MIREKPQVIRRKKYTTNHCLRGKNIYILEKKKEKANLVTPIENNRQICNRLVKRKKKNNVNAAKLQVQKSAPY